MAPRDSAVSLGSREGLLFQFRPQRLKREAKRGPRPAAEMPAPQQRCPRAKERAPIPVPRPPSSLSPSSSLSPAGSARQLPPGAPPSGPTGPRGAAGLPAAGPDNRAQRSHVGRRRGWRPAGEGRGRRAVSASARTQRCRGLWSLNLIPCLGSDG